jgi:hypothetical protein
VTSVAGGGQSLVHTRWSGEWDSIRKEWKEKEERQKNPKKRGKTKESSVLHRQ